MADQESMSDILSDKPVEREPEPREPAPEPVAKDPTQLEIPKLGDKPLPETPAEPKVERPQSRRKQWEEREQAAQGRVRDPETGQFTKVEAAAEPAPAAEPAKVEPAKPEPAKVEPVIPPKPVVAAPQQEFTEKEKAFQRAMMEERGKRQELEKRLAAIEAGKPAEPEKTFWDDPEAALEKHRAEIRTESTNARLQTAEFIARQKHPDFDEKIAEFGQILQQTPGLHAQWLAAPDPAEFAFNVGRNHLELKAAGSMEEMRAKIERETTARVRLEMEAELKAKAEALVKERAALPPSLSDARSSGVNKPVWGGIPSFDSILHDK